MSSKIYVPSKSGQVGDIRHNRKPYTRINSVDEWQALVKPVSHWKKYYSAYEVAHSWCKANPDLPPEIAKLLPAGAELQRAIPEHPTPLAGKGRASQSDVLALIGVDQDTCIVAIEGKVDEGFGKTVGEWLADAPHKESDVNRRERLSFVQQKLGLENTNVDDIRYQLLHRTAAAVIEAQCFKAGIATMIVHSFSQQHSGFWDFEEFVALFNLNVQRGKLVNTKLPCGMPLWLGWATST